MSVSVQMRRWGLMATLLAVFSLALVAGLTVGTSTIGFSHLQRWDPVLTQIRLPRVILAALAGGGLAAAGVAFQALLRNPLADPYIVGVSGGAALGGVIGIVAGVEHPYLLPAFSFFGAAASVIALFALAHAYGKTDPLTLLLAGVVFNAFAAAVVTFFKVVVSASKAQEILYWLVGSVSIQPWGTLGALGVYSLGGLLALLFAAGALNLLALGDEQAASLGLSVASVRLLTFLAAALLVGAVVAVAGMIGFVGLVVPHVLRLTLGADHRWLLPAATLGGAAFLVLSDVVARLSFLFLGTEIPVGAVTAFMGGPFFLLLLLRR